MAQENLHNTNIVLFIISPVLVFLAMWSNKLVIVVKVFFYPIGSDILQDTNMLCILHNYAASLK